MSKSVGFETVGSETGGSETGGSDSMGSETADGSGSTFAVSQATVGLVPQNLQQARWVVIPDKVLVFAAFVRLTKNAGGTTPFFAAQLSFS